MNALHGYKPHNLLQRLKFQFEKENNERWQIVTYHDWFPSSNLRRTTSCKDKKQFDEHWTAPHTGHHMSITEQHVEKFPYFWQIPVRWTLAGMHAKCTKRAGPSTEGDDHRLSLPTHCQSAASVSIGFWCCARYYLIRKIELGTGPLLPVRINGTWTICMNFWGGLKGRGKGGPSAAACWVTPPAKFTHTRLVPKVFAMHNHQFDCFVLVFTFQEQPTLWKTVSFLQQSSKRQPNFYLFRQISQVVLTVNWLDYLGTHLLPICAAWQNKTLNHAWQRVLGSASYIHTYRLTVIALSMW